MAKRRYVEKSCKIKVKVPKISRRWLDRTGAVWFVDRAGVGSKTYTIWRQYPGQIASSIDRATRYYSDKTDRDAIELALETFANTQPGMVEMERK